MTTDLRHLLDRPFPRIEHDRSARDSALYALALGFGSDPLDAAELPFVYEGVDGQSQRAVPTIVNVLGYPGFWAREPDTGIDWRKLVHAEQAIEWHAPVAPTGRVVAVNRVTGLWDRGAGKGAWMEQSRTLADSDGRPLATLRQLVLLRGNGGFATQASTDGPAKPHAVPQRAPDHVHDIATSPQAALLYRQTGDLNPLHADPAVAHAAGFERPILHGMATMGFAARSALAAVVQHDPARLAGMRVRFTAPAFPGDTLRTELWRDGDVVSLRTTAVERGVVVLDHGRLDIN